MEKLWVLHLSVMQEQIYKPRNKQLQHARMERRRMKRENEKEEET
jgi:hypothetical protein